MEHDNENGPSKLGTMCYWCCISNNGRVPDRDGNGNNGGDQPRVVVLASPDEIVSIDTDSDSESEDDVAAE